MSDQPEPTGAGLSAARIQFTDEPLGWKEAIARVAEPLVADGSIEARYVDAVITTAEQLGPYFDFGKGVAMPHARPEMGANRVALSFLRTRTPVLLLDQENHPIELFIMLSAPDKTSHLETLKALATVLVDPVAVEALKTATTTDEVLAVFQPTSN